MSTYFADTSFWIALSSKRDQHHRRAVAWSAFLVRTKSTIVTTEAVLWEWLNALADARLDQLGMEGHDLDATVRHFEQRGLTATMLEDPPPEARTS